jgi:Acetyltransferase (GNAT) family
MVGSDLPTINDLSDRIHINYPEEAVVFEEKLRLFPFGCFTLSGVGEAPVGYCFSHLWTRGMPPALDTLLDNLPDSPTTYFIHDLAVADSVRGRHLAIALLPVLVTVARLWRLNHMTLIAVNKSEGFWRKYGFENTPDDSLQAAVRSKYSDEAIHMELNLTPYF